MPHNLRFTRIGVAKEMECEENPGGHDRRVILAPREVKQLVAEGCSVAVQRDAGTALGHTDDDYRSAGASVEEHDDLYADKDLIVKYKGPSLENVSRMTPGSTLFCMAHLDVFSARRMALRQRGVNVVTMERIRAWRKPLPVAYVASREIARAFTKTLDPGIPDRTVVFVGTGERLWGALQEIARERPAALYVCARPDEERLLSLDLPERTLVVLDSEGCGPAMDIQKLQQHGVATLDVARVPGAQADALVARAYATEDPPRYGTRKIHYLFETGYCGARYGADLVTRESRIVRDPSTAVAVVMGYGNIASGAISALIDQEFGLVRVMTRRDLVRSRLVPAISSADLIVCGAEQDSDFRGRNFYVMNEDVAHRIRKGAAVIDLIGGTPNKRCPVEPLVQTTFLPDIHVVRDGVYVAGLWGWDLAGMVEESAATYSRQATEVLLGEDRLVDGLALVSPSVEPAVVLAPSLGLH